MKAEELVKQHYPFSFTEKQVRNDKSSYYILWTLDNHKRRVRIGVGDTKSKAYTDAKENILLRQLL